MSPQKSPHLRILVGAGSYVDAAAALRIVEKLAGSFQATLGGVLVEEETLEICQIPDQRIVQASGTTTLAPSLRQIRMLINADARAFQQSLERIAAPNAVNWIFAQERGGLVRTSLHTATGWDLLIIGYRQMHQVPGKIVVLQNDGSSNEAINNISNHLSDQLSVPSVTFNVTDGPDEKTAPPATNTIQFRTLNDSLKVLTRTNAEAVLVDLRRGPVQSQSDLTRVIDAARCPVIVFGASERQAHLEHNMHMPSVS
ncbi:hypothetical protein [uncultured Sulfitobacter sp.]|uniref:hypothetical protein n=1 Tax=uncultured Sulfitobacter sp. TaxID=191468 RepID=UPI002634E3C9|nr:hypothetical protein [uncultured Sulfitobacter sp.]